MAERPEQRRISMLWRVGAWILAIGCPITGLAFIFGTSRSLLPAQNTLGVLPLAALEFLFGGLCLYVAVTGHSPKFWDYFDQAAQKYVFPLSIKGTPTPRTPLIWVAAVLFGNAILATADARDVFGSEIRGMVLLTYALSAIAVLALLVRAYRMARGRSVGTKVE